MVLSGWWQCHTNKSKRLLPRETSRPHYCFIVLAFFWIQISWINARFVTRVVSLFVFSFFFGFRSYRSSNRTTRSFYVMKWQGTNAKCIALTSFVYYSYLVWRFYGLLLEKIFVSFEDFLTDKFLIFFCVDFALFSLCLSFFISRL